VGVGVGGGVGISNRSHSRSHTKDLTEAGMAKDLSAALVGNRGYGLCP